MYVESIASASFVDINAVLPIPPIVILSSGTRREELLVLPEELQKTWILRKVLRTHSQDPCGAIEWLLDHMKSTKTNAEFFDSMKRQE